MTTYVDQLTPGDIFKVDFGPYGSQDYKLIYVNLCRAYVEPLRRRKTDILDDEEKKHGKMNIAPRTECTKIFTKDPLEDDEPDALDDLDDEYALYKKRAFASVSIATNDVLAFTLDALEDYDALDDNNNEENTTMNTKKDPLDDNDALDPLDDDYDALSDSPTPAPTAKPTRQRQKRNADGSRRKEAGIQTREIKDGTIRAKLFAAMKTTKSVEKLMVKTGMAKNLLLSHINDIWRHHGFGYSVEGDKVELIPPKKVAIKK